MTDASEKTLLKKIKSGDRGAMKQLYDLYSGFLTAVCSRYITSQEDVRDILQDAFVKIFSSLSRFEYRGEGSLKAWMTRIVTNESLKFLRANAKNDFLSAEEVLETDIADEEDLEFEDIPPSVIQEMIRKLPDGYRTIFNLYVFEDKSHKEIADLLGIKENSSASQFHRARKLLASWIKDYTNP